MIVQVTQQPRQFSPPIQATDFPTKLLRLEFECSSLSYYTEIDAVCLLGTLDPISPSARATAMLPPPSQQRWAVGCFCDVALIKVVDFCIKKNIKLV